MSYSIGAVSAHDTSGLAAVDQLLAEEGIRRDPNLDYTCAMFDEEFNVVATGSCFGNTLRCLAVSRHHQGEGLMNQIVTHLINEQMARGNGHLFLYTKCCTAKFFGDLGFYEIVRVPNQVVFMENKRHGFRDYLAQLQRESADHFQGNIAALVMNCNPFTLGHQYLVEKAARENDVVHLFMVSEERSLFPFEVRKQLILQGTAHLPNVIFHETGSYLISQATFPSYFQKNEDSVIESNVAVDLHIFGRIAQALGIQRRYVGDEPFSHVTQLYNQAMQERLPTQGIECVIVPRKETDGVAISASAVRQAIHDGKMENVKRLVPQTTFDFLCSEAAKPIIARIQATDEVKHY